jgi:hypothetical protein
MNENDRRISGESIMTPRNQEDSPPRELPTWAIKMRWDYESRIAGLERKIGELEEAAMNSDRARRQASENTTLALYGEAEEVKGLTQRLNYIMPNAEEIGQKGVALVAQIAIAHGLDPLPGSDHVYAWKQGNKFFVTIGYKGLLQLARQQVQFTHRSRPMSDDERAEHGLGAKEVGYVTELYEIEKAIRCRQGSIPYEPIIGTAVWKPNDRVPTGRTPAWVAKKNSLKDALRQITTTGVRLHNFLDVQFDRDADGWQIDLPDEPTADDVKDLIEAGYIAPDQDDETPDIIDGSFVEDNHAPESDAPAHTDELPFTPAPNDGDKLEWRASTAPLTQATWTEFQPWLQSAYGMKAIAHVGNAVMQALREVGKVPPGDKPDWGAVFGKVTPGEVLDALDAHYAEPLAKAS